MKTKKSDNKEVAEKPKKSLSLRNDSKVKQKSIQSSERLCTRCKVHGITVSFKGHKCPKVDCLCIKCMDHIEKNRRRNEQQKKRMMDKKTTKEKTKTDNTSFANSLKNKSKKILNNKKKEKKSGVDSSATKVKRKKSRVSAAGDGPSTAANNHKNNMDFEDRTSPPRLLLQGPVADPPIEAIVSNSSSTTDIDMNPIESQPSPEKSSAALCGQYLRGCEELSRKLSKYKFSETELIAFLKYFIVRQSLGDIDRAINDIIFAKNEMCLGASYNIQHPIDNNTTSGQTSTSVRQTQQAANGSAAHMNLCSTMHPNVNFRAMEGHTYSPSFTPIRPNN